MGGVCQKLGRDGMLGGVGWRLDRDEVYWELDRGVVLCGLA